MDRLLDRSRSAMNLVLLVSAGLLIINAFEVNPGEYHRCRSALEEETRTFRHIVGEILDFQEFTQLVDSANRYYNGATIADIDALNQATDDFLQAVELSTYPLNAAHKKHIARVRNSCEGTVRNLKRMQSVLNLPRETSLSDLEARFREQESPSVPGIGNVPSVALALQLTQFIYLGALLYLLSCMNALHALGESLSNRDLLLFHPGVLGLLLGTIWLCAPTIILGSMGYKSAANISALLIALVMHKVLILRQRAYAKAYDAVLRGTISVWRRLWRRFHP